MKRKCDVCGKTPFEIYFNSKCFFVVFRCKNCEEKKAKINIVNKILRLVRHLIIPYKGLSC